MAFNSRASRLYHQRNSCLHDPQSIKYTGPRPAPAADPTKTVSYPDPEIVTIDCELSDAIAAPVKALETLIAPDKPSAEIPKPMRGRPPTKAKPEPDDPDDEPEDEPEDEPGPIPWVILIPIMILLLMCAGALLFSDKIQAYYRKHMIAAPAVKQEA